MARNPVTEPAPKEALGSTSERRVSKFALFVMLTAKPAGEIIAHLRFPNDPRKRQEVMSTPS